MSVTRADVERIAKLAALNVDEAALPELTKQIAGILDYVDQLRTAPMPERPASLSSLTETPCPLRPDEVGADPMAIPPKALAPLFRDGLFVMPAIGRLEQE